MNSLNPNVECSCPEEHSITKLGHCRTCPWFDGSEHVAPATAPGHITIFVCPPSCTTGKAHNFDWATYSDEVQSYGVCSCGANAYDTMLLAGVP